MVRPEDWPQRLDAYIAAHADAPFAWGVNDCVTFAAGWVERLTGTALDLPAWHDEAEAQAALAARGGLEFATMAELGVGIPGTFVGRGDVALVDVGGTRALGICAGARVALAGPDGVRMFPRRVILHGWEVPCPR